MPTDQLTDRRGRPYPSWMSPTERVGHRPGNAGKTYPSEPLTRREVHALMQRAGRGAAGARFRAAIALGWRCGMRASEVLNLEARDIDFDRGSITIRHGKGNKRRVIGLDAEAAQYVRTWMSERKRLKIPRGAPLFCTFSHGSVGNRWHYAQLAERMRELGPLAGIEKRTHFHGLRHTFAVDLLREGVSPLHIMKALGHHDLATTMRYLDHLEPGEVVDIMAGRRWAEVVPQQLDVWDVLAQREAAS
jgi:integrase